MKNLFTILVLLLSTTILFAQKAKINDGKFSNLKGITEYNLVFDYTDVQIPKYKSEEKFLQDKIEKRDEKEPGSGEKFKKTFSLKTIVKTIINIRL